MRYGFTLLLGAVALAGCNVDVTQYESDPLVTTTPAGDVVCQLYKLDIVMLDRAIAAPRSMSIVEADDVCRNLGQQIIDGAEEDVEEVVSIEIDGQVLDTPGDVGAVISAAAADAAAAADGG